jgi:hypothetical protein
MNVSNVLAETECTQKLLLTYVAFYFDTQMHVHMQLQQLRVSRCIVALGATKE